MSQWNEKVGDQTGVTSVSFAPFWSSLLFLNDPLPGIYSALSGTVKFCFKSFSQIQSFCPMSAFQTLSAFRTGGFRCNSFGNRKSTMQISHKCQSFPSKKKQMASQTQRQYCRVFSWVVDPDKQCIVRQEPGQQGWLVKCLFGSGSADKVSGRELLRHRTCGGPREWKSEKKDFEAAPIRPELRRACVFEVRLFLRHPNKMLMPCWKVNK